MGLKLCQKYLVHCPRANYGGTRSFTQLSFSSHIKIAALYFVYTGSGGGGAWGGGGIKYTRANSQVFVTGTNVNNIEDPKHFNQNHKQRFATWEGLFFCF
jgi:hypothetical protein